MPSRLISQKVAISVVYASAMFMAVMDMTIVNVALPTIAREFHATAASVAALVIGYQVSLAVFIPASPWLGDRLGARRVLLGSIAIFTIASALCGAAHSLPELIVFRVLQGVGGGLMTPVGLTMLFRAFPVHERVRASAILTIPVVIAPATGPVIGGFFVTHLSWRWVFYVNVPLGIIAVAFGLLYLADQAPVAVGRFDVAGFICAGAGLGLLMYGLSEGANTGWTQLRVLSALVVGSLLLVALVFVELRKREPLLDLRIYANRLFRSTSIVLTLSSISFYSLIYLLSLYLQNVLRANAFQTGLTIFPEAIAVILASQFISRRVYPSIGPRRILFVGMLIISASAFALILTDADTPLWQLRLLLFVMGLGVAGAFLPSQAAAFGTISSAQTGVASALFNVQRQLGGAVGVAVITVVISAFSPFRIVDGHTIANAHAFHVGFLVAALIALAGAVAALFVSDSDAAPTMRRRDAAAGPKQQAPPVAAGEPA